MSASRYADRKIVLNDEELYEQEFKKRGVSSIRQFKSPNMTHPVAKQISSLENVTHIWGVGDRFYKLSYEYYGSSEYWWVIAWYNQTPTEAHVTIGQTLKVPFPLHRVLKYLRG